MVTTTPDQRENISKFARLFQRQIDAGKPRFFVIIGQPGSGKSLLGKALAEDGTDALYISLCQNDLSDTCHHILDNPHQATSTLILDDVQRADKSRLAVSVDEIVEAGITVVLLVQRLKDVPNNLRNKPALSKMYSLDLITIED